MIGYWCRDIVNGTTALWMLAIGAFFVMSIVFCMIQQARAKEHDLPLRQVFVASWFVIVVVGAIAYPFVQFVPALRYCGVH